MEPTQYWQALRKHWVIIAALAMLGCTVGFALAKTLPPQYRATSSVFLSTDRGENPSELLQGSTFTQNSVESYAQLATLPAVLDPVIAQLGLDMSAQELAGSVTVNAPLDTVLIEVSVVSGSPTQASLIANAITGSLAATAQQLSPKNSAGNPSLTMHPVATASVPKFQFFPSMTLFVPSGFLGGAALGMLYAVGRELLNTRVRGRDDIERAGNAPLLGTIPLLRGEAPTAIVRTAPHSSSAEEFRRLRTNLEFADFDSKVKTVLVTSAVPGEGKSTTALNLALAMAERTRRVLLVDADLRLPSIADYCQLDGSVGLTSVLRGAVAAVDAIQPWAGVLDVLPAGQVPPNPNQVLGSKAFADFLTEMASHYDFVVIDSSPVLPATDALTLSRLVDGVLVVTTVRKSRRQQLAKVLDALRVVSAPVLGVVLNRAPANAESDYYGLAGEPESVAASDPESATKNVLQLNAAVKTRAKRTRRAPAKRAVDATAPEAPEPELASDQLRSAQQQPAAVLQPSSQGEAQHRFGPADSYDATPEELVFSDELDQALRLPADRFGG
jgi:capsular exopolysaccharide synthesis family protein